MDRNTNQQNNPSNEEVGELNPTQLILEILLLCFKIFLTVCKEAFNLIVPISKNSVKNEVVLITGAGHGIGKELALQYADLDAIVVCLDIDEQANISTLLQIKNKGKTAHGYTCDITKRNEVTKAVEKLKREVGNITILINNAGILIGRSLLKHSEEDIQKTFDVNVMSHFWMLQSVLPSMIEQNRGHIVALSSFVGLNGSRNLVPYSASKFAVRGIMSALREELNSNPQNQINLTTIFPLIVDTGLCKNYVVRFPKFFKEIDPKEAARCIIDAQRRNIVEKTIPSDSIILNMIFQLFPAKVELLIKDFVGVYLKSDK